MDPFEMFHLIVRMHNCEWYGMAELSLSDDHDLAVRTSPYFEISEERIRLTQEGFGVYETFRYAVEEIIGKSMMIILNEMTRRNLTLR